MSRCQHACTNAIRLPVAALFTVVTLLACRRCAEFEKRWLSIARGECYLERMGNTWGHLFRVTTWGESHGGAIGAVVDGCPSLLPITADEIQVDLDRRAPGQSHLVTQRKE